MVWGRHVYKKKLIINIINSHDQIKVPLCFFKANVINRLWRKLHKIISIFRFFIFEETNDLIPSCFIIILSGRWKKAIYLFVKNLSLEKFICLLNQYELSKQVYFNKNFPFQTLIPHWLKVIPRAGIKINNFHKWISVPFFSLLGLLKEDFKIYRITF